MARKAGGGMTVAEAGRMGGRLVSEKYGPEFYERIGKKGGSSTANKYGPEFFGRIGKKGGRAVTAKYGAGHFERIGRKGGQKVADLIERTTAGADKLKAENAQLQSDLGRTIDERDRLARDLAGMKREAEENWASERVENALLRERINDVAAEVARLASTLEGPNSPIDAILAAETVRDRANLAAAASKGEPEFSEALSTSGDLAGRIRALQSHASRVPPSDKRN